MAIIQLEGISKIYGKNSYNTVALNDITLIIDKGEYVAIMGPSGSGKSTLLNIIGCMDSPTEGKYYLKDKEVNLLKNGELSSIRNTTISFIFQHFALMKEYSIYDNVELPLSFRHISKKSKKEIVMNYLRTLNIEDQVNKKPNQLSGGQQQRVAIARALCSEAEIILADEPTGSLDQKTGRDIMNILTKMNRDGKTIIIITHDPLVAANCKRIITINDGKIIKDELNTTIA